MSFTKIIIYLVLTFALIGCVDPGKIPPPPPGYEKDVEYGATVEVTPFNSPITFSYDGESIKASYKLSKLTYLGTFSLKFSTTLYKKRKRPFFSDKPAEIPQRIYEEYKFEGLSLDNKVSIQEAFITNSDFIFGVIRNDEKVDIFKIPSGLSLVAILEGRTKVIGNEKYFAVDVRNSDIIEIKLIEDSFDEYKPKLAEDHPSNNLILEQSILQEYEQEPELSYTIRKDVKSILDSLSRNDSIKKSKPFIPY